MSIRKFFDKIKDVKKEKINSKEFAERMGTYSHGYKIEIGDSEIIFTTGQVAIGRYPKNWTSCLRDDILKNKKQTYDNKSKFNQ